jgi:chromosome segregation ATPase
LITLGFCTVRTIPSFLARKGAAPVPTAFPAPAAVRRYAGGAEACSDPTLAELGARIGANNEALRNLLTDTGRRITALDDVEDAFRSFVEPIGAVLRALEQEITDNVGLRSALTELRTSHETMRAGCEALKKRSAESASDNHSLRRELALAQLAVRTLESDNTELGGQLVAARAVIPDLERRLAQVRADARGLSKANEILVDRVNGADKRIAELQADHGLARQKLSLLEADTCSLQTALDQTLAENSCLSGRIPESSSALATTRTRLAQVEMSLASAEIENAALRAARENANERHESESYELNLQLEAIHSRASTAEKLLSEARRSQAVRAEEISVSERKIVEAHIARGASEQTVERLTAARDVLEAEVKKLEQMHSTLTERASSLSDAAKAHEKSFGRAEQKITSLTTRIDQLEHDARTYRTRAEKRIEGLRANLQRGRAQLAVALETTRRNYARRRRGPTAPPAVPQNGADVGEPPGTAGI